MATFRKSGTISGLARIALSLSLLVLPPVSAFAQSLPLIAPEPLPEPPEEIGGWYLRGGIAYAVNRDAEVDYNKDAGRLKFGYADRGEGARIDVGLGHRFGDWARADVSLEYGTDTQLKGGTVGPCSRATCASVERADLWMLSMMANAYADLGFYNGFSPYIGAGVGFSYLNWDYRGGLGKYSNEDIRFTYALMGGVSYDVDANWTIDAGYRFSSISDGVIVEDNAALNGAIRHDDLQSHEVRVGLRYTFGDFFE